MSLEQLQDNWPIIGGFVAGIVAWGKTVTTLTFTREQLKSTDARVSKIEGEISAIRESTASIAACFEATKENLDRLLEREFRK